VSRIRWGRFGGPATVLTVVLLAGLGGTVPGLAGAVAPPPAPSEPTVVAVYPNPVADGDRGEFVVLEVPPGTDLGEVALADGQGAARLPNGTAGGRVTLSTAPNLTRRLTGRPARPMEGVALANGGDRLRLDYRGRTVDRVAYDRAPEGDVLEVSTGEWRALGATDRAVVTAAGGPVEVFALPDEGDRAASLLAGADRRILLAGYTLTGAAETAAAVAAARRGVRVRVLVEGSPVGGFPRPMVRRLDRLAAAGAEVRLVGGDRARYAFHHAKYAVVDDRALVTTENWKPTGTGGRGSRGWGVVTGRSPVVRGLVATFRADAGWHDARDWGRVREEVTVVDGGSTGEAYPDRFDARRVGSTGTRLLVAPDNAEAAVVGLLDDATESVHVQQVSVGGRDQPFVRATLAAARRGVRVRVLLSGAWYVRSDNRNVTRWLNRRARAEGLDLQARVADPRGRYGRIHTKGAVVDDSVLVGSLNWNNHSARANREVALVVEGEGPARYYRRVFRADWRGGRWTLPAGVGVAVLAGALGALWRGLRVEFREP